MANQTIREQLKAKLEAMGFTRDYTARTRKYQVYTHVGCDKKIYLGSRGALRIGQTVADSYGYDPKQFLSSDKLKAFI